MNEDYWNFSKRERIGIFGITTMIVIVFVAIHFPSSKIALPPISKIEFENAVANAIKKEEHQSLTKKPQQNKNVSKKNRPSNYSEVTRGNNSKEPKIEIPNFTLSKFNPNTATKSALLNLGIPTRVTNTILNFRNKGGKFFKPKDLKVIYGLSDALFTKLEPYIDLPIRKQVVKPVQIKSVVKLDLNLCTEEELMELRGIGPTLSKRIIKFRNALGGFYNVDQLIEVYNLPDSTLQAIKPHLFLSPIIQKTNINDLHLPKNVNHPYISWELAAKIIALKDHEGKFTNWAIIEKNIKITTEELDNIKQYFTIR